MGAWKQQFRRIMEILRRRGQSREDAEDLVQEAFLRLHVFLEEGNDVRTPDAFLVRTALNLAVDARRKNVRDCRDQFLPQAIEDLDLAIADLRPTPEEAVTAEIRLGEMRKVLDEKLSPTTREVFFLHRLEGLSHEEISEVMGISLRSVEKRIARAITVMWMERRKE